VEEGNYDEKMRKGEKERRQEAIKN